MVVEKPGGLMRDLHQGQCKDQLFGGGAYHLFDGMPMRNTKDQTVPACFLKVRIHQVLYPITENVMHQVFDPFGVVRSIEISQDGIDVLALVQYDSSGDAARALEKLQGRNIYDGCCTLHISYAPFLHVTIHHEIYPVTEEVLHQIFDAYGAGQKIHLCRKSAQLESFIPFLSYSDATQAREAFHGRHIWDGCCLMDIQYLQQTTCLTTDVDDLMETSTPAKASWACTTTTTLNIGDTLDTSAPTMCPMMDYFGTDRATVISLHISDLSDDVPAVAEPSRISLPEFLMDIKLDTPPRIMCAMVCSSLCTNMLSSPDTCTTYQISALTSTTSSVATNNIHIPLSTDNSTSGVSSLLTASSLHNVDSKTIPPDSRVLDTKFRTAPFVFVEMTHKTQNEQSLGIKSPVQLKVQIMGRTIAWSQWSPHVCMGFMVIGFEGLLLPWLPPVQANMAGLGEKLRPTPWPLFNKYTGSGCFWDSELMWLLRKPPWPYLPQQNTG